MYVHAGPLVSLPLVCILRSGVLLDIIHFLLIRCVLNLMLEFGGVTRFGCTLNCKLELWSRVEDRYIDSGDGVMLMGESGGGRDSSLQGVE